MVVSGPAISPIPMKDIDLSPVWKSSQAMSQRTLERSQVIQGPLQVRLVYAEP